MAKNMEMEEQAELISMMDQVNVGLIPYASGSYIMTDDKAPVELLGMKVIDELISDEVSYYRSIYESGGIKALLEKL